MYLTDDQIFSSVTIKNSNHPNKDEEAELVESLNNRQK
jgi:hypothetical protein